MAEAIKNDNCLLLKFSSIDNKDDYYQVDSLGIIYAKKNHRERNMCHICEVKLG